MKYGLALAGGGTRGAFEAGVWRALGELGIEVAGVTGTSIGAVNGAMFAQGKDPSEFWLKTGIRDIVSIGENDGNLLSPKTLVSVFKSGVRGGLDTAPFRRLLESLIDEDKLRGGGTEYGLCTFCVTDRRREDLFLEDIPDGRLVDYILASACFPLFKNVVIDGKEYVDGAMLNNLPSGMLISRGYDTVIAVSVKGVGVELDPDRCGANIIEINAPSAEVGLMDFDSAEIRRSMDSGYLETMRVFGRMRGERYYIEPASHEAFSAKYGIGLISDMERAAELAGVDRCRAYGAEELADAVCADYLESARLRHMVELIENGRSAFVRGRLDALGGLFRAANAIVYLRNK